MLVPNTDDVWYSFLAHQSDAAQKQHDHQSSQRRRHTNNPDTRKREEKNV